MKHKVVYNAYYGGFSLSLEAVLKYHEKKGIQLYFYEGKIRDDVTQFRKISKEDIRNICKHNLYICDKDLGDYFSESDKEKYAELNNHYVSTRYYERHDPVLIEVVEELGEKANGEYTNLLIREIEGNRYRISEYDGNEWVITPEEDLYVTIEE